TTVLEVIVDSEGGVSIDEISEYSRWISAYLDEHEDLIPGRYRLEVGSAGLDRALEYDWQFRKNEGRLIKVTFDEADGVRKTEKYRLLASDDESLTVGTAEKKGKP